VVFRQRLPHFPRESLIAWHPLGSRTWAGLASFATAALRCATFRRPQTVEPATFVAVLKMQARDERAACEAQRKNPRVGHGG